ncbi:hypothetical protein FPZ54_15515 [Sphingomonas suaedae]|uniref:Uncharacterized protein n=1 Tax=Sphingomonas suaedae TaxID=2599297 RepID=A0A518RIL5_9SPHN|nr:DUF6445 family protein [Sphingomonas suaedae]QDX27273.1 hypothetical protein FPZ54_15515 [Sphingomonas suaedae]
MTPVLHRFGTADVPVVVVDGISGDPESATDIAAALAPFPVSNTYYPGVRRILTAQDRDAVAYVDRLLEASAPFIAGAFDTGAFDLTEASFSIVTTPAAALNLPQRIPHFDSTDPAYLAILHYLSDAPGSGTAFYRQRATGIEVVSEENRPGFIAAARAASVDLSGYLNASNAHFEQIGRVDAVRDRIVIYPSNLLHSGIIPADLPLDADPRRGRLTANIFVRIK